MKQNCIALLLPLVLVSGCASIVDGRSEKISINTNPQGATCSLASNGASLGVVQTPATIEIQKTKYDVNISCSKQGYQTSSYLNHSGVDQFTFGNIIFGIFGLAGWGLDSASGSDNKYDSVVNLTLPTSVAPTTAVAPAPPATVQDIHLIPPAQPAR